MPWKIVDEGNGLATVVNQETGKKMSKKPIPKKRAQAQLKALYSNVPEASKKEVSSAPTGIPAHGDGGLFSTPGIGGAVKPKKTKMSKIDNDKKEKIKELVIATVKGGAGSGNFGHAGIPGHLGGSAPSKGSGISSQTGGRTESFIKGERFSVKLPKTLSMAYDKILASKNPSGMEKNIIGLFSKKSLSQLRSWQSNIRREQGKFSYTPEEARNPSEAMSKGAKYLDTMDEILTNAIDKHSFPRKKRKVIKNVRIEECSVSVFKQSDGRYRWVTLSSNAFKDRDDEIVSFKALEKDVDRASSEKDFGPLRWWHVPGADLGDCDYNSMFGKMLIESGTFRDNAVGKKFKEYAGDLQVSIGFYHPVSEPDKDGVFHHIKRYERSLLPKGAASNLLTSFMVGRSN